VSRSPSIAASATGAASGAALISAGSARATDITVIAAPRIQMFCTIRIVLHRGPQDPRYTAVAQPFQGREDSPVTRA